jgi:hypothetical protein
MNNPFLVGKGLFKIFPTRRKVTEKAARGRGKITERAG